MSDPIEAPRNAEEEARALLAEWFHELSVSNRAAKMPADFNLMGLLVAKLAPLVKRVKALEEINRMNAGLERKIACDWHFQDAGMPGEPCGKCLSCRDDQVAALTQRLTEQIQENHRLDFGTVALTQRLAEAEANRDAATLLAKSLQSRLELHEQHDEDCLCSGDGELHAYSCMDCSCDIGFDYQEKVQELREATQRAERAEERETEIGDERESLRADNRLLRSLLAKCDPADVSHLRYLEHEAKIDELRDQVAILQREREELKRTAELWGEKFFGERAARQKVEEERDKAAFRGGLAIWQTVASLIRSGTPDAGLLLMAEQNIAGLEAALTEEKGKPKCAICGKPAACLGRYEDPEAPEEYACDSCCGHGNEDGRCRPVGEERGGGEEWTPLNLPCGKCAEGVYISGRCIFCGDPAPAEEGGKDK